MRLTRVKLFGFKTFADRTEFSLEGGVVAVVGPNGCGKSNLVDAILWGLGEGSIKHLRASSSQDVIFSGAQARRAVGFAEVSLCFDNEDGSLPIDATEVWVTRRLTRAGDSEYSINRQSCRLRDVVELMADSGLGRAGYAIVGQKEIDQALSASAEDRRAWIDEAAGVQRYRTRKVESLRRLSSARDSLARVDDILRELESQREPLEDEAEQAKRYKSLAASLQEVEIGLLIRDLCAALTELRTLEEKLRSSGGVVEEENRRVEELEKHHRVLQTQIQELEASMEQARLAQQTAVTGLERAQANVKVLEERLSSLANQEKSLEEDSDSIERRLKEATTDLEEARTESEAARIALETIQSDSAGANVEAKALSARLSTLEKQLNESREQKVRRLKWEAEQEASAERAKLLQREIAGIEKSMPDLHDGIVSAQQEFDEVETGLKTVSDEVASLQSRIVEIRKVDEDEASRLRNSLAEQASLEGRRRGIEATLDAHEGLSQGSRAVLEASERGILQGKYESVADAVEVDREFSLAIETALGASANDLIVDHDSDAKRAVGWLKENRAGRCTFQPIPLMRPQDPSSEFRRVLTEKGVVGRASQLVECENRVRPVIDSLLGRVIIVDTLDDALRLAKTSGWNRLVTVDGEVVHNSGAVTGGQNQRQGYGIVQRKSDLAEIEKELEELQKLVAGADKRKAKRALEIEQLRAQIGEQELAKRQAEEPVKEALHFLRALQDELKDAERQLGKARAELDQIQRAAGTSIEDVDIPALESERDGVIHQLASKSADAEQAETRLREAQERARSAQTRQYAAEKRLESAHDAEKHRGRRLENLGPEREKTSAQIEVHRQEAEKFEAEKGHAMVRLTHLSKERRERQEEAQAAADQARQGRENVLALGQANHQAELARARAETRRATTAERLMDAYGLTEEDAVAQEGVHEIPDDAQQLAGRLRREIKAMGDVNVGAIEAYERLTERLESLGAQREDTMNGIVQVEASIKELDKLTRDKFVNTFNSVRDHFAEMFTRLFGGGAAEIMLTEPDNVLETGVDIVVQLPGKKRQPLQLLSGGERSLCASAFLFALLRHKPAPLVVLDEVDAPLDGRNVERFAEVLLEFSQTIQFICITHNPTTVAAAPVLLGVTMQEPGVSTLVPMRLPGTPPSGEVESAAPAPSLLPNPA